MGELAALEAGVDRHELRADQRDGEDELTYSSALGMKIPTRSPGPIPFAASARAIPSALACSSAKLSSSSGNAIAMREPSAAACAASRPASVSVAR